MLLLEAGPAAEDHPETLSRRRLQVRVRQRRGDVGALHRAAAPLRQSARLRGHRARCSGGSGSVNGMVYTRGACSDYAEWPEGWRWNDVVPDFEAIEKHAAAAPRPPTRWTEACISAAVACGFERRDNLNDGMLGNVVGYECMSYEGDRRRSSYVAFIKDAPARPNLVVRPQSKRAPHRVRRPSRRAIAVEYRAGRRVSPRRRRQREVVLAAGALETPKLLMLSGIGPGQALRACGIPCVHESPVDRPEPARPSQRAAVLRVARLRRLPVPPALQLLPHPTERRPAARRRATPATCSGRHRRR